MSRRLLAPLRFLKGCTRVRTHALDAPSPLSFTILTCLTFLRFFVSTFGGRLLLLLLLLDVGRLREAEVEGGRVRDAEAGREEVPEVARGAGWAELLRYLPVLPARLEAGGGGARTAEDERLLVVPRVMAELSRLRRSSTRARTSLMTLTSCSRLEVGMLPELTPSVSMVSSDCSLASSSARCFLRVRYDSESRSRRSGALDLDEERTALDERGVEPSLPGVAPAVSNILSMSPSIAVVSSAGSGSPREAEAEAGRGLTGRGEPAARGVPSPSLRRRDELVGRVEELVRGTLDDVRSRP